MYCINEFGAKHPLFSLWKYRKVVICFARHMGCMFCKEQVSALQQAMSKLAEEDVSCLVITIGYYQDIPKFRAETGFQGEIYVDEFLVNPSTYRLLKSNHGREFLLIPSGELRNDCKAAGERASGAGFTNGGYPVVATNSGGNITEENPYSGDIFQVSFVILIYLHFRCVMCYCYYYYI